MGSEFACTFLCCVGPLLAAVLCILIGYSMAGPRQKIVIIRHEGEPRGRHLPDELWD